LLSPRCISADAEAALSPLRQLRQLRLLPAPDDALSSDCHTPRRAAPQRSCAAADSRRHYAVAASAGWIAITDDIDIVITAPPADYAVLPLYYIAFDNIDIEAADTVLHSHRAGFRGHCRADFRPERAGIAAAAAPLPAAEPPGWLAAAIARLITISVIALLKAATAT